MPLTTTPLLVLHPPGRGQTGAPWAEAFAQAGWTGPIDAPDLPGHGTAAPPVGGNSETADPFYLAVRRLRGRAADELPVVVGVAESGWSAAALALGGRARAAVVVDGLGGPWRDPEASVESGRAWLRGLLDDPAAMAGAPPGVEDPRLRHRPLPPITSRRFAVRVATALAVPVLVVETADSPTPAEDRAAIVGAMADASLTASAAPRAPHPVATAVVAWASRRSC